MISWGTVLLERASKTLFKKVNKVVNGKKRGWGDLNKYKR